MENLLACIFILMLPSVQYEKVVKVKENINSGSKRETTENFYAQLLFSSGIILLAFCFRGAGGRGSNPRFPK